MRLSPGRFKDHRRRATVGKIAPVIVLDQL
jgi:hypothetical protein